MGQLSTRMGCQYLHVLQPARISPELGEVLADVDGPDLVHQQVGLVEEEDDGEVEEELVVDDGLKDVHALHQAVGAAVLHQDLQSTRSRLVSRRRHCDVTSTAGGKKR